MNTKTEIERKLPEGSFRTKLKFEKSDRTGCYVGFVSKNWKTGAFNGVRQNDPRNKKVCIVDAKIAYSILPNVLYDVVCIPMKEKDGYVVIEANPHQFTARIETTYVPKCVYVLTVKFGNKTFTFDPKDGHKPSMRKISGVKAELERRVDIKDITTVVDKFEKEARELVRHFTQDGFLYVDK